MMRRTALTTVSTADHDKESGGVFSAALKNLDFVQRAPINVDDEEEEDTGKKISASASTTATLAPRKRLPFSTGQRESAGALPVHAVSVVLESQDVMEKILQKPQLLPPPFLPPTSLPSPIPMKPFPRFAEPRSTQQQPQQKEKDALRLELDSIFKEPGSSSKPRQQSVGERVQAHQPILLFDHRVTPPPQLHTLGPGSSSGSPLYVKSKRPLSGRRTSDEKDEDYVPHEIRQTYSVSGSQRKKTKPSDGRGTAENPLELEDSAPPPPPPPRPTANDPSDQAMDDVSTVAIQTRSMGAVTVTVTATATGEKERKRRKREQTPELMETIDLDLEATQMPGAMSSSQREMLIFPSKGSANAVVLTAADIERLQPATFLNDTIVEFYLRFIEHNVVPKDQRDEYLFFNPFFYKKMAITEQKCENLQRWTRGVDVFSKKFLVIPINESEHWTLAIVCLAGDVFKDMADPCILFFNSLGTRGTGQISRKIRFWLSFLWKLKQAAAAGSKGSTPTPAQSPNPQQELAPQPTGAAASAEATTSDPPAIEKGAEGEEGEEEEPGSRFNCETLQSVSLKLPQQQNFSDCGVFLLHYAELFVSRRPEHVGDFAEWFNVREVDQKRGTIKSVIERLIAGQNAEAEAPPAVKEDEIDAEDVKFTEDAHEPEEPKAQAPAVRSATEEDLPSSILVERSQPVSSAASPRQRDGTAGFSPDVVQSTPELTPALDDSAR